MTWTITINTAALNEAVNAAVTQTSQSGAGVLAVALVAGHAVTTLTVRSALNVIFDVCSKN